MAKFGSSVVISAASLQAMTDGHAYWIRPDGSLLDAGTDIKAAAPTNQPQEYIETEGRPGQWAIFYGAQTALVGGKIAMAELWPTQPVDVVGTIPPYVRDVASHLMFAAGLSGAILQRVPADIDTLYDTTSATNTALDTGIINTEEYSQLWMYALASGGTTALAILEVDDAGTATTLTTSAAALSVIQSFALGAVTLGSALAFASVVSRRHKFTTTAAGVGFTVRLRILGRRAVAGVPMRVPRRMTPYIQVTTHPTTANPIYIQL